MTQEYIVNDIVMYDNKIMVVKEPRDGIHFDLSCPKEGLVYCFVSVEDIKPVVLTPEILEKNGWKKSKINDCAYFYYKDGLFLTYTSKDGKFWFDDFDYSSSICVELPYVHSLQHLLFGLEINQEMEV
jgi:hypothetical protein